MKRILSLFGILSAVVFSAQNNLTNTENYTYTKECLNADCTKVSESVQYFDSFGRPFQAVSIKSSPSGKDMVQHIPYDSYGRKVDSWFPVPMPTSGGAVHDTAAVKSNAVSLYGDNRPFSHTVLDNSPLDRVLQQISPGQDWQNHPAAFAYETNINGEVKKYMVSSSWTEGRTESVLSLPGSYPANTLTKNTVTDQDGKVSVEYKNKQGQLIMARKGAGTSDAADTYYVYNEFGHLVYVIPPLASASGSVSQDTLEKLCYQYRYDGWNRLVEKRLPGKGWEYMVYDKADKLILTQDANQRTSFSWMIYKYDAWGRPIYTGILTANNTRPGMQSQISDTSVIESRNTTGLTANDMTYYYSNMYWGLNTLLSVTYYDSYPQQYGFNPPFPSTILGEPVLTETPDADGRSTKGLPVMSLVKNIENDSWTKTYTYYDQKGRAIGTYSINHLGGYTKTESKLDFAGLTLQTKAYHKRLATDTEKLITQTYDYDAQGRLLVHKHKIDNNPEEILKQNTYNELSQIVNKKVGGTNVSSPLQSIDYTYNILGWLTKINDPANLNGKLFGYEMKYFNPQNTTSTSGKYGGNITEIDWKTATDNVLRRYDYQYDALNRLKKGIYSEPGSSVPQNDFYNEAMSYDLNGNVSSLQRNTKGEGTAQQIDNLIYTYTGNRLQTVVDNTGNYMGYPDSSGSAISYDDNGNMTDHIDKGILEIKYNYLNLPGRMKFSTTYVIRNNETGEDETRNVRSEYIYRADRTKLRKKYTFEFRKNNTERTNTTDYLDGFQYTINHLNTVSLDFVPTSEGYYDFKNNKYIYNYTDQLGNVRLSYQNNGSGAAVLEENNYYPFGLKHEGYNYTSGNPDYRYQYNDKELQDDTGMLDYGWRQYIPELGRWNGMDQLSESYFSYSPYAYVMNNPVMMYDPDGRLSQDWLMSFYNNSQNGYNTTWRNTGMGFTNNWGGSMNYEGVSTNFYFGGTSTGIGDPNGIYINVPTVELQARGNSNTWNKGMNLDINSFLMSSLFTGALGRATYDMNSSNMGSYILNSKASMEVAAFENFLFLELPASFAGEGLLVAGWRAAGLSRYICRPLGKVTNGLIKICFTEGTLVAAEKGNKKIEDIKEGDFVWSYNEETGKKELKKVVALSRNTSSSLVRISINGTEITCTPEHPFYVNGNWIEAKDLTKGMLLTTLDGKTSPVESIKFLDEKVKVYNFEVEGNHNYYVSEKGILVHNTCWTERLAKFMEYAANIETKSLTSQEATINHLESVFKILDKTRTDDRIIKLVADDMSNVKSVGKGVIEISQKNAGDATLVYPDGGFQIFQKGKIVINKIK